MDATFVIPREYQISIQKQLSDFHIISNKDFLAIESPLWMKIFVAWELVFQLPFFIYAIIDYLQNNRLRYSKKLWGMFLLYGFNAGFTSFLCMVYVFCQFEEKGLTFSEGMNLLGLYTPTMLLPFYMMYDFWIRINTELLKQDKKDI